MPQAVLNGTVVAEAPESDVIRIEGNVYFPPSAVRDELLRDSPTPYTCPWKGEAQYFSVVDPESGQEKRDAAWSYPEPLDTAIDRVGRDFSGYVAFWRDVKVDG